MATTEQPPEPPSEVLIPSLPNDVALNILARLPRQYHPVLSAVSKAIRSAVSSPHFFAVRSLINRSENILYLRVESKHHTHDHWFAVHRNPNPINDNLLQLAPLPRIPTDTKLNGSAYTAVGPKIYVIGGYTDSNEAEPSSDVWVLDCRSHTWERGPSMRTPRSSAKTAVVDGKLYVVGRSPENLWVEVVDPALGRWKAIPSPLDGVATGLCGSRVADGKIIIWREQEVFGLDPRTKTWEVLPEFKLRKSAGYIVRFLYGRKLELFDKKTGMWKELKGAEEGKPKNSMYYSRRVINLDGRYVVTFAEFRTRDIIGLKEGKYGVWFAEIDMTKNKDGDWWGRVHWSEKVPLLPEITCRIPENDFYFSGFYNWQLPAYSCKQLSVSF